MDEWASIRALSSRPSLLRRENSGLQRFQLSQELLSSVSEFSLSLGAAWGSHGGTSSGPESKDLEAELEPEAELDSWLERLEKRRDNSRRVVLLPSESPPSEVGFGTGAGLDGGGLELDRGVKVDKLQEEWENGSERGVEFRVESRERRGLGW